MNLNEGSRNSETARIKLSSKLDKRAPVFLADFAPGRLNNDSKISFTCYKYKEEPQIGNKEAKRLLTANSNSIIHSGMTDEDNKFHRYFVGVRNKINGKMKLYDASLFQMKPNIQPIIPEKTNNIVSSDDYWTKRNILTAAFGGKAQQRTLNEKLKYSVNSDSLDNIDTDISTSIPTLSVFPTETSGTIAYLPPINRDASDVSEVFNVNDIISPEEDIALQENSETLCKNLHSDSKIVVKDNFCKFVQERMEKTVDDLTKLKYLMYYNYLTMFHKLTYADINKKDPAPHIPEPFKQKMIHNFTNISKSQSGRHTRTFPSQMRDKLTACILVLGLFIDDYCVDVNQIISDMKRVSMRQLCLIAQSLGCYLTTRKIEGNAVKFAELKLPLNVMPSKFSKRQF